MIGTRLKELRKEAGITQLELSKILKVTPKAISFYELDERSPSPDMISKIADYFHVSTDYLYGKTNERNTHIKKDAHKKGVRIPVLGTVVAGIPIDAIENIEDYEEIPEAMARKGDFFALRIKGHSMEPKLQPGDTVIVEKMNDVDTGSVAIVLVNGYEATCKQIKKVEGGIVLYGFNTDVYEPHFYSNEEIMTLPVQIIGKVVESRHHW